ncbi:MAG: DUF6261 family protein [Paludibacter sp.]
MKDFISLQWNTLRNDEFKSTTQKIEDVIKESDPSAKHLVLMLELLEAANASMVQKQVYNRKLEHTPFVKQSQSDILRYASSLLEQLNVYKKTITPAMSDQYQTVRQFVEKYQPKLKAKDARSQLSVLKDLFSEYDADTELIESIEAIHMKTLIDGLRESYLALIKNSNNRTKVRSKRKIENFQTLRKYAEKALSNMLKAIELAVVQYPTVDYSELIADINDIVTEQKTIVEARITRNDKKSTQNPE